MTSGNGSEISEVYVSITKKQKTQHTFYFFLNCKHTLIYNYESYFSILLSFTKSLALVTKLVGLLTGLNLSF